MENHPIPQDVTGFQFKLIGNMTVKQFAYLITGIVLAWVILQLPTFFIIKFPISVLFAVLGISLAYLPVEGRPLDTMISHFIKAIISPTQFVYQKTGGRLYFPNRRSLSQIQKHQPIGMPSFQNDRLKMYLRSLPHAPGNKLDDKEANFLGSISNLTASRNTDPLFLSRNKPTSPTIAPLKDNLKPEDSPSQNKKNINENLGEKAVIAKKTLEAPSINTQEQSSRKQSTSPSVDEKMVNLENRLREISSQKEQLAQQLLSLRQKMNTQNKNVFVPSTAILKTETKNVKRIPQTMGKNIGLPTAPTSPNILSGIVKDPRGNPIPGILLEVKDKEGNPVRAFKTNELGRFLSATPLINGVYTIEFEDPRRQNKFDAIEITISGDLVMPLEVISIDTREILRKSLFGN